jgi:uncharacterized protein YfdQ (DUF2303 family)
MANTKTDKNEPKAIEGELLATAPQPPLDAKGIADVVRANVEPRTMAVHELGADGAPVRAAEILITSAGLTVHDVKPILDRYRKTPERRRGTARLADLDSFIAHVMRFQDSDSAVFAQPDPKTPNLTAVLDYHRAGANNEPRFGEHRATYAFPLSDEWTTWTARDGGDCAMSQAAFAEFIEDRIADIADPAVAGEGAKAFAELLSCEFASPSRLLELSRGLSLRVGSTLHQRLNLASGETQFTYAAQHQDETGAPLKVPGAFLLAIPVFRGGALYQVPTRLRYRASEGSVRWFFEMYRTERVFEHAFEEACERVVQMTKLPVFKGIPE